MLQFACFRERVEFLVGSVLALLTVPPVGAVIGSTVFWEAIDRGFKGGLVESNNELTGLIFGQILPWITRMTEPFNKKLVKNPDDAFLPNAALFFVLGLPLLLTSFGRWHLANEGSLGVQLGLCWAYHVMRIGPFFMNFAYVYVLCHKEGHAAAAGHGMFAPPFDKFGPFRHIFNWWVGLYYGVMPASFAVGHSINHHKYNNGPSDVISVADKPRDEWTALICYIPRFLLYACNVSTVRQFYKEGRYRVAWSMVVGTLYYVVWYALVSRAYGPLFAFMYIAYPFFEQTLMLSGINWVWHAFIDPDNAENEYVQSITILGGTINVLNEDAHVVHHQYPGAHWNKHPRLLTKHHDGYRQGVGSVFYGTHTFEVLALILLADYDKLADRFVGYLPSNAELELFGCGTHDKTKVARPKPAVSHDEAKRLLKERLRACWWGPRVSKQGGEHEGMGFRQAAEQEWAPGFDGAEAEAPAVAAPSAEDAKGAEAKAASGRKARDSGSRTRPSTSPAPPTQRMRTPSPAAKPLTSRGAKAKAA